MVRPVEFISTMRSSWHRGPMAGIGGRECSMDSNSPRSSLRRRNPGSTLAAAESSGDLTSPCSHANGLCFGLTAGSVCQTGHIVNGPPNMGHLTMRSSGPPCAIACAPRALWYIVRPQHAAAVTARPMNASVRRRSNSGAIPAYGVFAIRVLGFRHGA